MTIKLGENAPRFSGSFVGAWSKELLLHAKYVYAPLFRICNLSIRNKSSQRGGPSHLSQGTLLDESRDLLVVLDRPFKVWL